MLTLRTDLALASMWSRRGARTTTTSVLDQVRALPGVTNAAYISGLPMVWGGGIWPVGINGVELERRRRQHGQHALRDARLLRHAEGADPDADATSATATR